MKKRFDRLKQAALEKIGVAEFTDVPKIKEDYKVCFIYTNITCTY